MIAETRLPLFAASLGSQQIFGLVVGVAVFILLMAGSYFALKWLSGKGFSGGKSKYMKVLDRLAMSKESSFILLEVGSRIFAVAVSKDGASVLGELDRDELGAPQAAAPQAAAPQTAAEQGRQAGFGKRMAHNLKLNMGLLPKGTPPLGPTPPGKAPEAAVVSLAPEQPAPAQVGPSGETFRDALAQARQRQQFNPISSAPKSQGTSGQTYVQPSAPPTGEAARYDEIINNMRSLGQLDGAAQHKGFTRPEPAPAPVRAAAAPDEAPTGPPRAASMERPPAVEASADEKMDQMFDLIAKRKARFSQTGGRGKEAP